MDEPSTLLQNLQNHNFTKIDQLFCDYLHPLSTLISRKPQNPRKKPTSSSSSSSSSIRSLAKTFLPFIGQAVSLLTKILSQLHPNTNQFVDQLIQSYRLCLDCLDAISSELSGKPYSVHLQRVRFLHCLVRCQRYEEAMDEGFRVLKGLGGVEIQSSGFKIQMGRFVPCLCGSGEGLDGDFVHLIVDVSVAMVHCVSLSKTKDAGKYTGLLVLIRELQPWFRYLDASAHSTLRWKLLTCLRNATMFLIRDVKDFEGDLVSLFFSATLDEYTGLLNGHNQGRMDDLLEDFATFVYNSTHSAQKSVQNSLSEHLYKSAANISQDLTILRVILRLYAMGLYISEFNLQFGGGSTTESEGWEKLQDLSILLVSGKEFYCENLDNIDLPLRCGRFIGKSTSCSKYDDKSSTTCASSSDDYLSFYLNALKFICTQLAEFVNSERERIVTAVVKSPLGNGLKIITEALLEYCRLFLHCQKKNDASEEIDPAVFSISVAAFTLSLKLNFNTKESRRFMNCLLSDEFIFSVQYQRLKRMIAMLHNIFVEFYRHDQLREALKNLKLCCKASWSGCLLLCKKLEGKAKRFDEKICETMIVDSVHEACKLNSLLVNFLHQSAKDKLSKEMVCSLEKWCHARSLFENLPTPNTLLKDWVKIQCKLHKKTDTSALILGSCLVESTYLKKHNIPTETVAIILEQELSAYQELSSMHAKFCQRMQMDIVDILLSVHYSKKCMQRSLTLVKKARLLRACGIRSMENCMLCLSESIESIENNMSGSYAATQKEASSISCQLAVAYCLRALCTQESNPNSKEVIGDIRMAVSLWSRTSVHDCSWNGQTEMGFEYVRLLLYHIADLLSMKGDMDLQLDVVNVITKIFKQMNVPLEKCLSLLWGCRRLNHALCVVPVNEAFIMSLSEHYGKDAESLDFWFSSLNDSPALSVGLQQNFSCLRSLFPVAFHELKYSLQEDISIDKAKGIALRLISNVSNPGHSVFLAGYLFRDLSERLSASGRMSEALFCAKEAHRLHGKLLQEYFSYSFEQTEEKHGEPGETMHKSSPCVGHFSISDHVAISAWPNSVVSGDSDGYILTPWNVLRCFLESTLQIGIIHETLGNGAEAEAQFKLGKSISCLQSLPIFVATFSSYLGKVYLGKNQLDLAHKELQCAEQVLAIERDSITCSGCLLMLESAINEQLGNLYRRGVDWVTGNPYELALRSLIPLEEGGLTVWLDKGNSAQTVLQKEVTKDAKPATRRKVANRNASVLSCTIIPSGAETVKTKAQGRNSRRAKPSESLSTDTCHAAAPKTRITRSRKQSDESKKSDVLEGVGSVSISNSGGILANGKASFSDMVNCQKCVSNVLRNCGQFTCFLLMKREFIRRRQILRLLVGLGKCQVASAEIHKIYSKGISILLGGTNCECSSSLLLKLDLIGKEDGNVFAYEEAEIIYHFCWFSLKALYSNNIRCLHCDVCCTQVPEIISLLKLSFVLSREMPFLFQKVSRLLALVYLFSALKENPSSSLSSFQMLSENYWAAYFHQASVGVYHNVQLLTGIVKHEVQIASKIKGAEAVPLSSTTNSPHTLLRRIIPASMEEIEACATNFFQSLPNTSIVSLSLLRGSYVSLLEELMDLHSGPHGWILLSHLNGVNQPAVVLLPMTSLQANPDEETSSGCSIFGEKNVRKEWCCPWGCSDLVENMAPLFRMILRGNYVSCTGFPEEDTESNRKIWWTRRVSLDKCLHRFLRDMEDLWFGPWKFLLLGRWLDCEPLDSAAKELVHEIKVKHGSAVKESILKIVMGGVKSANLEGERIPWKFLEKGCYIGQVKVGGQEKCTSLAEANAGDDYVSKSLIESMLAAANKLEADYCTRREPVILVLDNDIQMLPWENMPILREQEVYRMPSVVSVLVALQRRCALQEGVRLAATFPLIDPLDAFYLLNPSGDLSHTQSEFEEWFRFQNIQGNAGIVPKTEELVAALRSHDLFLYFGHGSGAQYIPRDKIQKLENCAATLLMGCSSGSLTLNGQYSPSGAWLSYILAGSPIVVANLWEVTDRDIDRFAKVVLKSFMDERSMSSNGCIQCSMLAEELKSLSVNEKKGNTKKGRGKKKEVIEATPDITGGYCYRHKLRAGYFVSQARTACKLPFLIGAAPVSYGVPTGIRKKIEI